MIFFYIYPAGYMGRPEAQLVMEVSGKALVLLEAQTTGSCKSVLNRIITPPLKWKDLEVGEYTIQEAVIIVKENNADQTRHGG